MQNAEEHPETEQCLANVLRAGKNVMLPFYIPDEQILKYNFHHQAAEALPGLANCVARSHHGSSSRCLKAGTDSGGVDRSGEEKADAR